MINRLNKRVILKFPDGYETVGREKKPKYKDKEVYAGVEPITGKEFFAAAAEKHEANVRIIIRYREDINQDCKVKFENTTYDVKDIIDYKMKHEYLQLLCKAVK